MATEHRRKLSDILDGQQYEQLARQFAETEAALEYVPIPAGTYEADFTHGELCRSSAGTAGYRCTFEIATGEFRGRRVYHTFWLSEAALPYSKRDMKKLGIVDLRQCEQPVPPGIFCTLHVVERMEDDGTRRNDVRKIVEGGIRQDPTADEDFGFPPRDAKKGGANE